MRPILFHIGDAPISSYGIAIAIAFLVAVILGVRSARRQAISVTRVLDLAFWIIVTSLLGSRLLFVLTHAPQYYRICAVGAGDGARGVGQLLIDCSRPLHVWEGGLVYYGGLLAATIFSWLYTRRHQMDFFRVADLAVPLIALGHFIGRVGCFTAGCCYGAPTSGGHFGVRFGRQSFALQDMRQLGLLGLGADRTPALHPTQLYEAAVELVLFVGLTALNAHRAYFGQTFVTYMAVYPVARAVIELYRADPARRFLVALGTPRLNRWLGLPAALPVLISTSQAISAGTLVATFLIWRHVRRRATPDRVQTSPSESG